MNIRYPIYEGVYRILTNILDPIELYIKMNGMPECELRFRNTVLVTLDTGSGTKKTLS